jgi:nucleotide-binding universal stress UspA family protein
VAVVCGTDFSAGAAHAVRVAAAFARAFGERLVLVHVVDLGALGWAARSLSEQFAQAASARLAEVAQPLANEGIEVETRALVGMPDERIAATVREVGARLLVTGVLGHRSAEHWRVGSLATRLARLAPAPVLLVGEAEPFEQCARGERALRVLVAVSASASGDVAAGWLATLRQLGPCDALLLHVYEAARERQRLGLPRASEAELEAALRAELEERFGGLSGPGTTELRVAPVVGWVADSLALAAERERFDVVLVGGRRRDGLARIRQDSVSEGLLRLAPASVLRVPLAAAEPRAQALPALATVLAPSDLSEPSNEGVRYAYALAPPGGTVVLLHVIEAVALPNPLYAHYGRRSAPEERVARERAAEAALRALVPAEAEARGVETRIEVVEESAPADAIRAAAERHRADVVCLATHGRSGISRLLGGSVVRALVASCPKPLLLVRPPRED